MKRVLSVLISINMLAMPAMCQINDDFVQNSLNQNVEIKKSKTVCITDDFAENSLEKGLKVKKTNYKPIKDSFAESNKSKKAAVNKSKVEISETLPNINKTASAKTVKKTNIEGKRQAVQVRIKDKLTTKTDLDEGDYIDFVLTQDVCIKNKTYPQGSTVKARIETLSMNKVWGVPSDIIVGSFSLDNIPLNGEISKVGANRSIWVYPSVYVGALFFGAGLLLIPIRGGHAKINTSEVFTLYTE